jgi:predicted ATPase
MRIRKITARNFKSLVDFAIEPAKFSCLIGLNGSGKSTVLQLIDFIAQQARGEIWKWLAERVWRAEDLPFALTPERETSVVGFSVSVDDEQKRGAITWEASFSVVHWRCFTEVIDSADSRLEVSSGRSLKIIDKASNRVLRDEEMAFRYEGSVLSQLRSDALPPSLAEFRDFIAGVHSFDLLSPENMRVRTSGPADSIGRGGWSLSSYVRKLGSRGRAKLASRLKAAYPHFEGLSVRLLPSGQKRLEIEENFGGRKVTTEARHINDGMLRLIAILAELQNERLHFLLFDEIENGINPEVVEFLLDTLVTAPQQVMVTTHSPLILNYLDDQVARDGVIYVYKTEEGHTRAIPFFSIPSLAEKLKFMGPGEAFADTDLTALRDEIIQIAGGR